MAATLPAPRADRHRVLPEKTAGMARADLRKAESDDSKAEIGGCLDFARRSVGWTLDQLAGELKRDPRQVRRWIAGEEIVQVPVVFRVKALRKPFVIALAQLAECEVETTVRISMKETA